MAMNADITIVFACKWFHFDLYSMSAIVTLKLTSHFAVRHCQLFRSQKQALKEMMNGN